MLAMAPRASAKALAAAAMISVCMFMRDTMRALLSLAYRQAWAERPLL